VIGGNHLAVVATMQNVGSAVQTETCLGFLQLPVLLVGRLVALDAAILQYGQDLLFEVYLRGRRNREGRKREKR